MDSKKLISKVTEFEKNEIQRLYERKNTLAELFKIVDADNDKLYNRIIEDMGKTSADFQKWWDEKSKEHSWEAKEGYSWEIDFNDGSIYLVKKS